MSVINSILPIIITREITVAYEDLGEPTWSVDRLTGKIIGSRSLKCAWADRDELVRQLLGYMEVQGSNLYIHRPQLFPTSKLNSRCYAQSVIVKRGPGNRISDDIIIPRTAAYQFAQIDVNYSNVTDEIWRRETLRNTGEMVIMPGEIKLGWSSGGEYEAVEASVLPGYIIHGSEWTYTIYQAGKPIYGYGDLAGCCNLFPVRSPTFGWYFPIGTLKFIGATFNIQQDFNGNFITEHTLTFHARKEDWNKFPHEVNGQIIFAPVYNMATDYQYIAAPYADFRGLII